jgi:hypothetical protein
MPFHAIFAFFDWFEFFLFVVFRLENTLIRAAQIFLAFIPMFHGKSCLGGWLKKIRCVMVLSRQNLKPFHVMANNIANTKIMPSRDMSR